MRWWQKKMKNCRKWKNMFGFLFTGVAEQFALAEAAMNVWSMNDGIDQPSTSLQGLKLIQQERLLLYCEWQIHTGQRVRHFG